MSKPTGRPNGRPSKRPPLEEVADAYHLLTTTMPVRLALAQRYGVSRSTVDDWIQQAREAELIRAPANGREKKEGGHHGA